MVETTLLNSSDSSNNSRHGARALSKNAPEEINASGPTQGNRELVRHVKSKWPRLNAWKPGLILAAILLFFGGLLLCLPLESAIRIGADEDFELSKATLLLKGFHLYTDIWDDQPPLHTHLVAQVLKHLTPSVLGPRLLTVGFSILLLSSVYLLIYRIYGVMAAALATLLLIASPAFLELGCSVMQEIPALAPAVAGISLILVGPKGHRRSSAVLAGILFAIALQIKFIGVIYLPLAAFCFWLSQRQLLNLDPLRVPSLKKSGVQKHSKKLAQSQANPLKPLAANANPGWLNAWFPRSLIVHLLCFSGGLLCCFLLIHFSIGKEFFATQFKQAWDAHFASAKTFQYGSPNDHPYDWMVFVRNWDLTVPAVAGLAFAWPKFRATNLAIIPLAWLGFTLLVFGTHKPWWSYYYLHNAIPLCWLATIGIVATWNRIAGSRKLMARCALFLYLLAALPWMGARLYLQITTIKQAPQNYNSLLLTEIERYKPYTTFLYTDEPIFTFHAGIPLPPRLAVVSMKRFWSGNLSNDELTQELQKTKPGLILLGNDTRPLPFTTWMDDQYRLIYQDGDHLLYARPEVSKQVVW